MRGERESQISEFLQNIRDADEEARERSRRERGLFTGSVKPKPKPIGVVQEETRQPVKRPVTERVVFGHDGRPKHPEILKDSDPEEIELGLDERLEEDIRRAIRQTGIKLEGIGVFLSDKNPRKI